MDEKTKRDNIIREARRLYVATGKTKNISTAVSMFWEKFPSRIRDVKKTLTTGEKNRLRTVLDDYDRPPCPKCGKPLFFGVCSTCKPGKRKKNEWVCRACGYRRITKHTLAESLAKLKRKKRTADE